MLLPPGADVLDTGSRALGFWPSIWALIVPTQLSSDFKVVSGIPIPLYPAGFADREGNSDTA